jgi:hypothetical protein
MPVLTGCEVGDVIVNNNLRNDNPEKIGFFMMENGMMHLFDENGHKWAVANDKGANLSVLRYSKLKDYMQDCRNQLASVKEVIK